jgi:serine/threonine protein kinase
MGVVYQAVQPLMGRTVAIKVLNPSVLEHPDALPRFLAEVKAAARLDHRHIVRAYDAEQVGNLHLLVMEFVEGCSLDEFVEQRGPLSVARACHYARQAAKGLQHACEWGMAHRDVKPQNLMVSRNGIVKVLDFGLARLRGEQRQTDRVTTADSFLGSVEYVAPEQAVDARAGDTRSDVYGLGGTLYFLLTGRPPFVEETDVKLILAHIEQEPRPLHERRPAVPRALSAVVGRMLAKDPRQRYQTPLEVARALKPFSKPGTNRDSAEVRPSRPVASSMQGPSWTPTPASSRRSPRRSRGIGGTATGRELARFEHGGAVRGVSLSKRRTASAASWRNRSGPACSFNS